MPNYTYRAKDRDAAADCPLCADGFETFQNMSDDRLTQCPSCEAAVERIVVKTPVCVTSQRWNEKRLLSDDNLRKNGFQKLVKKSDGSYEDVLKKK